MAQSGYTPISLYHSTTTGNTPASGDLIAGELAINTADGKLFYKDPSNVVKTYGVTTFSAGTTGFTPSTATSGTVTLSGTLGVANGGTNNTTFTAKSGNVAGLVFYDGTKLANDSTVTNVGYDTSTNTLQTSSLSIGTLTGLLKGATGAVSAASAGTDYVAPGTATTFTATQTFNGTSSVLAEVLRNAAETVTISATAATGTIAIYPSTQSVLYYTSNASANWTVNLTFSSGTTMNTALSTGQAITVVFMATQGGTAYYNSSVQVDGTTSGVTTRWQGGAPTAGNASGIDAYTYTVIKTGASAFTVIASVVQFKA